MYRRALWAIVVLVFLGVCRGNAQEVVNLLTNGGFEDGTLNGWRRGGGCTIAVVQELVGASVPEGPIEGNYCMHVTVNNNNANFWNAHARPRFDTVFEAGKKYTLSLWLKCSEGTREINLKPEESTDPWTGYGNERVFMTDEWAEYHITTPVMTEDVSPARIMIHVGFGPGEFWIDDAKWYEGDYPIPTKSRNPNPADGDKDVPREVILSWEPGKFAPPTNGHIVYWGENFADVNDATGGATQDANSYDPGDLTFGTTYYWRVDEVNSAPDNTVFKGNVWQFTTETFGWPIANVTATASSTTQDQGPASATVDGSGLTDDLHSTDAGTMWLSNAAGPQPTWIEFEFDKVYALHEMWVWNSNRDLEPVIGYGFKDVTIEYSIDGTDYTTLGTTHEFAPATGTNDYTHNTTVDFGGHQAKYVRLTPNSNWKGYVVQFGLSEVRFFHIPLRASGPNPDPGTTDVDVDATLSFQAGRQAAEHNVYLSTDEQAVIDGTAPVVTVTEPSYASSLDLIATYYWRVDEVNDAETPTTWQGDIWNFTTQDFIVVDDFESYNDIPSGEEGSNLVYVAWVDGFDNPSANGSTIGYVSGASLESDNVHGGNKSVPVEYNNTAATLSEVTRTLAPRDWTANGIQTLSLWFFGETGNTGQIYLKINGFKIPYNGDAGNLGAATWQPWNIDLTSVGVNLQSVTSLAIGVEGFGAKGTLLLDDIRLYGQAAAPAAAGVLDIPKTSVAPIIDGQWDAVWNDVAETRCLITDIVNATSETPEDEADLSAIFKACYDNSNFYIFVEIQDSVIDYEFSDHKGDGVEIYFDGDLSRGSSYDGVNDNQIRISVGDVSMVDTQIKLPVPGMVFKVLLTDLGYNVEASFPLATLKISPLAPNNLIGFEVQINDNDASGGRQTILRWYSDNDDSYRNPSLFGVARLLGQ